MYAQRAAAWDAKNRFGLPESLPMSFEPLRGVFGKPSGPAVVDVAAEKPLPIRMAEYIEQASTVKVLGKVGDKIDSYESDEQLTKDEADALRQLINQRHQAIEPAEVSDAVA